jgi:hypothetical protein
LGKFDPLWKILLESGDLEKEKLDNQVKWFTRKMAAGYCPGMLFVFIYQIDYFSAS